MKNRFTVIKKTITKIFKRYPTFSAITLLFILLISSAGQVVNLYFFGEDWNLMFKLAHPNIWFAGLSPGIFGDGPYKYMQTWYLPFYFFFKLNPFPYFLATLIFYFLTTICIYFFSLELSRSRSFAMICGALFASMGYIGSQTFINLYSSYPIYISIILTCLTSLFLVKYYNQQKLRYYILSIIFFYSAMEFVNFRSHAILPIVLGLGIFFSSWRKNFKNVLSQFVKIFPFVLLYFYKYGQHAAGQSELLPYFFNAMSPQGSFGYIINPFGTFSNILIPEAISKSLFIYLSKSFSLRDQQLLFLGLFIGMIVFFVLFGKKRRVLYLIFVLFAVGFFFLTQWVVTYPLFWKVTQLNIFVSFIGFLLFLICLAIANSLWDKNNLNVRILLFGLLWVFAQYATYFIFILQDSLLPSDHKYIKIASVGSVFILAGIVSQLKIKKIKISFYVVVLIIVTYGFLTNSLLSDTRKNYSEIAPKLYSSIQKEVPFIKNNSKIFLDAENLNDQWTLINNLFLSLGLALHYNLSDAVYINKSFEEIIDDLVNKKSSVEDVIGLHIAPDKVTNTSSLLQELLTERKITSYISSGWTSNVDIKTVPNIEAETFLHAMEKGTLGINPILRADVDHPGVVPSLLSFTMSVSPKILDNIRFPYLDVTPSVWQVEDKNQFLDVFEEEKINKSYCDNRLQYINSQASRNNFLKTAEAFSAIGAEDYNVSALVDGKIETFWLGNEEEWKKSKGQEVTVNLGSKKLINRIIWINHSDRFSPKEYRIYVSDDGNNWKLTKYVENGKRRTSEEIITETIDTVITQYIKMSIVKTIAEYPPAISEIWADEIEGNYAINIAEAEKIIACPFCCPVNTRGETETISNLLKNNATVRIWWTSNTSREFIPRNSRLVNLIVDGNPHTYEIYIPSEGTEIGEVKIEGFQFPVDVRLFSMTLETLTLKEIVEYREAMSKAIK